MEFRILGPLEVLDSGEPIDIGPHKQKSLLALLLIHANRVVPTDRLLDELWGEDADGKQKSLWVYVSRLRSVLEPELSDAGHGSTLTTRDHGYVLNVDQEAIDAVAFERAALQGHELLKTDAERASALLHGALDLWHGSALQDFTYDEFAQTEIARLEELRLNATEDSFDADLRCGRSGELIADMEAFQDLNPLRERPTSLLMLALYRSGRSARALRAFERFRRTIGEEMGIDPSPELRRLEEQILLHDSRLQLRTTTTPTRRTREVTNPFKGLRPFHEDDAADFFGRERLLADVFGLLSENQQLIVLVGPSGSGKSSVVRAGLIPAIRKGAVKGSDKWRVATMLPGSDPFVELEAALLRASIDAPETLGDTLQTDDRSGLLRAALRILPDDDSRLILTIDQFEEMFTVVADESTRTRFIDQLVKALDDPYGRVTTVITLRSDFYSHAFNHPAFAERMASGLINVVPMASDELETAALGPAESAGVVVEPALLAELLSDVIGQPGGLPLFQYTLTDLFDRRVGDRLTVDMYRSIDGVRGALTRRADELYDSLDSEGREAAQQLFLRLVTVAPHEEWVRRRVPASEIVGLDVDMVAMQRVIELFSAHRLVSLDKDLVTGAPTVEVAHEALLTVWERLRLWIEDNRDDLVRHRGLAAATTIWAEAGGDEDYLYSGRRLDEALAWAQASAMKLTTREQSFLSAGQTRQAAEREAAEEVARREQRLQRRAKRRTRALVSMIVALGVMAIGIVWFVTRPEGPKVALVHGGISTIQDLLESGWNRATREYDFEGERIVALVDDTEDVRSLAASGYGLIIDGLFDDGRVAYELAEEFPDVTFVVFDGKDTSFENVTALHFVREGGAFLMGAAAALTTRTDAIGFIGGYQQATTESRRASYTAGALSINPDIEVTAVYLGPYIDRFYGGYLDYDLAYQTASDMYRSGIDVIHHSAGEAGLGIPAAAADLTGELGQELWVIGSEIDERRGVIDVQAERYLTSMWKRWDQALVESVRSYLAGDLEPGVHELGLASRSVDFARDGGLSKESLIALDAIREDIIAGVIDPAAAQTSAPEWNRDVDMYATFVFDGEACTIDTASIELTAGDVVRFETTNNSLHPIGLALGPSEDGVELSPWIRPISTLVSPGHRSAVAMRLASGTYVAHCFTPDEVLESVPLTATYEAKCDLVVVGASDPVSVIKAVVAAAGESDADTVCSLIAHDAELVEDFEGNPVFGGLEITDVITPDDDDVWFQKWVITDIELADGVVVWNSEYRGLNDVFTLIGNRAVVVDGRITRWEWGNPTE